MTINCFHVAGDPDNGDVLKCVVLARNTRGATTRTVCPVVVPPQNFSKEEIKNTTDEISEKLNQNKIAEVQGGYRKVREVDTSTRLQLRWPGLESQSQR